MLFHHFSRTIITDSLKPATRQYYPSKTLAYLQLHRMLVAAFHFPTSTVVRQDHSVVTRLCGPVDQITLCGSYPPSRSMVRRSSSGLLRPAMDRFSYILLSILVPGVGLEPTEICF